ncbi:hypothetical protein K931_20712 [Aeromonas salmonicida subsp. pectinolytica 34mel]|nr:hypothetical protein K931_20712 [Aeromonas salmonicida subsp. pectinolytica 34mel]
MLAASRHIPNETDTDWQLTGEIELIGRLIGQGDTSAFSAVPEPPILAQMFNGNNTLEYLTVLHMESRSQTGVAFYQVCKCLQKNRFINFINKIQRKGQIEDGAKIMGSIGSPQ